MEVTNLFLRSSRRLEDSSHGLASMQRAVLYFDDDVGQRMDSVDFSLSLDWSIDDNVDTGVVDYSNSCAASHDVVLVWFDHFE